MPKTIFVSIVHEDKVDVMHTIENFKKQGNLDFHFIKEEQDLRNQGEPAVKNYLKGLFEKSQVICFFIGPDTHNHDYIKWEHQLAGNMTGKKMVYFKKPGTNFKPHPIMGSPKIWDLTLENFKREV